MFSYRSERPRGVKEDMIVPSSPLLDTQAPEGSEGAVPAFQALEESLQVPLGNLRVFGSFVGIGQG
jgi:hypothetical protein